MDAGSFPDDLERRRFRELQRLVGDALTIADDLELWAVGIPLDKARLALIDIQQAAGAALTLQ